jgi:hypothetical protein
MSTITVDDERYVFDLGVSYLIKHALDCPVLSLAIHSDVDMSLRPVLHILLELVMKTVNIAPRIADEHSPVPEDIDVDRVLPDRPRQSESMNPARQIDGNPMMGCKWGPDETIMIISRTRSTPTNGQRFTSIQ